MATMRWDRAAARDLVAERGAERLYEARGEGHATDDQLAALCFVKEYTGTNRFVRKLQAERKARPGKRHRPWMPTEAQSRVVLEILAEEVAATQDGPRVTKAEIAVGSRG